MSGRASPHVAPAAGGGRNGALGQYDWDRLAVRARRRRGLSNAALIGFLVLASVPILLPYFWVLTISFSAKTGGVESVVLWRACGVLVPAVIAFALGRILLPGARQQWILGGFVTAVAVVAIAVAVGPYLHFENYRFFWIADIVRDLPGRGQATHYAQFPSVWTAFRNSLLLAVTQTVLVVTVATFAGYYVSRFAFAGRASFLQALLVLHAFPAMTLIIPIFLLMHWTGMLDTITGVILVICTLELPFAIFIMKGFFDSVPWDIEMSAMTDGASRRQAFFKVVLPQVKVGMLAIGVFAFIKGLGGICLRPHPPVREVELDDEPLPLVGGGRHNGGRLWDRGRGRSLLHFSKPPAVSLLPALPRPDEPRRHQGIGGRGTPIMARIELSGIRKAWGEVVAVEGMDLVIRDGEFVAVLGPSGCGKSTTLFMLAGIYAPSSGEMRFDGALVNEVESKDRNVGIVFQSYALYPHMNVRENIMFPLRFKKVPEVEARRRIDAIADLVQVHDLLDRRPAEMSGGQQQRVALARALVKEPQLLLLNEPLSNLDATPAAHHADGDQAPAAPAGSDHHPRHP